MADEVKYPAGPLPSDAHEAVAAIMREVGIANLSIKVLRRRLEMKYHIEFTSHKESIQEMVDKLMSTKEFQKELARVRKGVETAKDRPKKESKPKAEKAPSAKRGKSEKAEKVAKTSKREKKETKPENYPKSAMTAYFLFANDQRAKIKESNPNFGVTEVAKAIGELWKSASDAEKERYSKLAAADKDRFNKEMEAYEDGGGQKLKRSSKRAAKEAKPENYPKSAMTAYFLFANDQRAKIKESNPNFGVTEVAKAIGELWKSASDAEKERYSKLAAADKDRFNKEMEAYEAAGGKKVKRSSKSSSSSKKQPAKKRAKKEKAAASGSSSSSSDSDSSSSDSDSSSDSSSSDSSSSDSSSSDSD